MASAVRKSTGRQATEEADTLNRTGTKLTTSPGPVHQSMNMKLQTPSWSMEHLKEEEVRKRAEDEEPSVSAWTSEIVLS